MPGPVSARGLQGGWAGELSATAAGVLELVNILTVATALVMCSVACKSPGQGNEGAYVNAHSLGLWLHHKPASVSGS